MAEASTTEQTLRDDNRRLEKQVEDLRHEIAGLKSKDTEAALSGLRTQVQERDSTISDLTTKVSNRDQTIADLNTQLETVKEASKSLQARAEKAEGDLTAAAEELSKAKAAEARRSRLAILKQKGADAAVAEKLADRLASLDDEAFGDTVESIAASWKKPTQKVKTDPVVAAIDRAKAEDEPAMATTTDDDGEREQTRASIERCMSGTLSRAREGRPSVYAATQE
jgi:chromosome segregation ATPase